MSESKDSTRRLHHTVPPWVPDASDYHIRIRIEHGTTTRLTESSIANALLRSAARYHLQGSWFCHLLVLMPDHLHALLCFPRGSKMTAVVGRWKAWQKRTLGIPWQKNFFDHRIRNDHEFEEKAHYIRRNPLAAGLCAAPNNWPWVLDLNNLPEWREPGSVGEDTDAHPL